MSDLTFDARVWKETRSLVAAGYRVKLIGCTYEVPRTVRREQDGVDVVEVPLGSRAGRVSIAGRTLTLLRLWIQILRTPADAYHAHNIHVVPAAWTASRFRRAKLVYDAHELYGDWPGSGPLTRVANVLSRRVERFVVRASDAVITTNASRAEILRQRHGREDVTILGNVPRRVDDVVPLDPGYPRSSVLDEPTTWSSSGSGPSRALPRRTSTSFRRDPSTSW